MIEIFRMAEEQRKSGLAKISLTELMKKAAKEAGWHIVEVPNLNCKDKRQVRYERPFSSAVASELVCRIKLPIYHYLKKRDFDPKTISSHIGYGVFKFIQTYKPEVHNSDEIIMASLFRIIRTKVEQSNRKELFRYRPGYQGVTNRERKMAEEEGRNPKARYTSAPKEISIFSPIFDEDHEDSAEMIDFISQGPDFSKEVTERSDLIDGYGEDDLQKEFIQILIDMGQNGKASRPDVVIEAMNNRVIISLIKREFKEEPTEEEIRAKLARKVKVFFKEIKEKLQRDFSDYLD